MASARLPPAPRAASPRYPPPYDHHHRLTGLRAADGGAGRRCAVMLQASRVDLRLLLAAGAAMYLLSLAQLS